MPDQFPAAEPIPVGAYLTEEMKARGWDSADVAVRMGGDAPTNQLVVDLLLAVHDKKLVLDSATAFGLGRAFDVSPRLFINLDRAWRGLPSLDA